MTDTVNTRRLALDVLLEVTEHGAYSNQVLRAVLEKYQYMEKYERAFLTRLVEGTIQHMIELDYVIDQFSKVKVKKNETGHPQYFKNGCVSDTVYGFRTGFGSLQ